MNWPSNGQAVPWKSMEVSFTREEATESVVKYDAQERSVDLDAAVVFDETHLPEFVHEKIDA